MIESSSGDVAPTYPESTYDRPAVGLVATPGNTHHVAGEILRAIVNGYKPIVTGRTDCEGLELARSLYVTVVEPPELFSESEDPKQRLVSAAREQGHPGLLYNADPSKPINYARSKGVFTETDEYVVEAPIQPIQEKSATVVVGIPSYNEESTIEAVVTSAKQYADEVVVVDDGSDDDTARRAREAGATVVVHERNRGYGAALKTLFEQVSQSQMDHLVVIDADGQHDTSDIPRLVETQRDTGADIVIGCRFGDETDTNMPGYRRFGLGVINLLTNLSLGRIRADSWIRDSQSGFRVYSRRSLSTLASDDSIGDHMNASTDIIYHAHEKGYDISEVPVTIDYDVENSSTLSPITHGMELVGNIVTSTEQRRPLTALGVPGVIFLIVGFSVAQWTIYNAIQLNNFSLWITVGFSILALVGLLVVLTAIVVHAVSLFEK